MPGHWGGSSGGGGPAGGASSGGNYGGGGGHHHGGGGGGGQAAQRAAQQAAAQRAMQQQIAQAEAQQAAAQAEQAARNREQAAQRDREAAAQKVAAQKAATAGLRGDDPDLDKKAWDKIYQKQNEYLKTVDANTISQLELDKIADDTLHQMYLGTGTPATQDYQNIFQTGAIQQTPGGAYQPPAPLGTSEGLGSIAGPIQGIINQPKAAPVTTGEGPSYQNIFDTGAISQTPGRAPVINPFEQPGARTAIPTTPLRTRIQDERVEDIRKRALGNIALQTDKSLMDVSDPSGQRQGIMSGLADMGTKEGLMSAGKNYAKKAAINYGLQKLGLGFINPLMGLASLFGFKMPKGTGTKTAWAGPSEEALRTGEAQNVIQAGMEKFQPTDQQTAQMTELMRKRLILQGYADKGALNEQGMSTLAQMNQLISQYQANPRSIFQ